MRSLSKGVSSTRILELDALRGLAAVAVVLFHYTTRYEQLFGHSEELTFSLSAGHHGVDLFFMLSGFVILMTLERTNDWMKFAWGRFSRLYPTYWAAAAVTFIVVAVYGLSGQEVSLGAAMVNVSMLQGLLQVPHIDGAYWSLQAELIFYVNMLLLYCAGAFRRPNLTVTLWVGLAFVFYLAEAYCQTAVPVAAGVLSKVSTVTSLSFIPLFGIGIVLFASKKQGRFGFASRGALASCLLTLVAMQSLASATIVAGLATVLLLAVTGRLRILASRPLVFLGAISYTLYLLHQNIGYVIIRSLEQVGVAPSVAIAAAFVGSLFLATALHRVVEKPSMNAMRKINVPDWVRRFKPGLAGQPTTLG